jgi:glycosyltransferase involved in cell wall biosynthesis
VALARAIARQLRRFDAHARGMAAYAAGPAPAGQARVWYGHRHIPATTELAVGGIVKLQHLSRAYPAASRRFNILYLVSSRLPEAPTVLADWAQRKGAALIVNQNGVAYPAWAGPGWAVLNEPMRDLLARADHVFYQSAFCRTSADRFAGPSGHTSEILYNPVDTSHFTPDPARQQRRGLTLLLGGSQDQWYRFESAARTVAVLARRGIEARLLVTGRFGWTADPGAARLEADRLLSDLRIADRVELIGPYTQADAPSIVRRADIVLHTKYNDPCPTAVLEALACGCPVVYSASGGVPELVGDDAGVGVGAELSWEHDIAPDPEALADGVCRVRDRIREYADAARTRAVERFDVARWLDRHRETFDRMANRHE